MLSEYMRYGEELSVQLLNIARVGENSYCMQTEFDINTWKYCEEYYDSILLENTTKQNCGKRNIWYIGI